MKRYFRLLMLILFSIALIACTGNGGIGGTDTTEGEKADTERTDDGKQQALGIGDTAEVEGIKFTLKNVSLTDERNEYAETQPAKVVRIEYEIENNTEDEIPVGGDLEVYDNTGNKVESYPLDNTLGSLQPGKKMQGVEHFGISEGPIEIYFQPLLSFEKPVIFKADVE